MIMLAFPNSLTLIACTHTAIRVAMPQLQLTANLTVRCIAISPIINPTLKLTLGSIQTTTQQTATPWPANYPYTKLLIQGAQITTNSADGLLPILTTT